jgi:hypothetical protein
MLDRRAGSHAHFRLGQRRFERLHELADATARERPSRQVAEQIEKQREAARSDTRGSIPACIAEPQSLAVARSSANSSLATASAEATARRPSSSSSRGMPATGRDRG